MKWTETDAPATDVNVARICAKYLNACYIIWRPVIFPALHYGQICVRIRLIGLHAKTILTLHTDSSSFSPQGWVPPALSVYGLPHKYRLACERCVEALIKSTVAFDKIEDRLVVPNIFSIAHAQFGSMLILPATYTPASPSSSAHLPSNVSSNVPYASCCVTGTSHLHCAPTHVP